MNKAYRELLRSLGEKSKTEIEPREVTILLDLIQSLKGVVYCISPGSGGFDALAVVYNQNITDENALYQQIFSLVNKQNSDQVLSKIKAVNLRLIP